jgi:hypothetical protein
MSNVRIMGRVLCPPIEIWDQSGAVPGISTIATYPASFIALIPDLETISEFEILLVG